MLATLKEKPRQLRGKRGRVLTRELGARPGRKHPAPCHGALLCRRLAAEKKRTIGDDRTKKPPGATGCIAGPHYICTCIRARPSGMPPSPDTPCAARPESPTLNDFHEPPSSTSLGVLFCGGPKRKAPPTKRGRRGRYSPELGPGEGYHPNPCHVRLLLVGARPLPRLRSPVQRAGDSRRIRHAPVRACRGQDRLLVEAHFLRGCSENVTVEQPVPPSEPVLGMS
jgi:hypothetical protein